MRDAPGNSLQSIDVYGPGSRSALVKASSGDVVNPSATDIKNAPFYLFVLHGQFTCTDCSGPAGSKPPRGTIETFVWSPKGGGTDFGIGHSVPAAVGQLNLMAQITAPAR